MKWTAIAYNAENIIIASDDDVSILNQASEKDFDIFVRVYGVSDEEYQELAHGNFDFRIKIHNPRSIELVRYYRPPQIVEISKIYQQRIELLKSLRFRYEHAANKYKSLTSYQNEIYLQKFNEATDILTNDNSIYLHDGLVKDYADEAKIDCLTAATLISAKYNNRKQYFRNLERLRIRHVSKIKLAQTEIEFTAIKDQIEKDLYTNMLL